MKLWECSACHERLTTDEERPVCGCRASGMMVEVPIVDIKARSRESIDITTESRVVERHWRCPQCGEECTTGDDGRLAVCLRHAWVQLMDETSNVLEEDVVKKGAWFVFGYDTMAYPIYLTDNELEARRFAMSNGYTQITFWEFGIAWSPK